MSLSDNELARRDPRGLMLQSQPLRVLWSLDDLRAADGHALRCRFSCGVRAVDDPAERQMLQEVLMGSRPSITADDVMRYMQATLREAAVAVAKDKGVEAWLAGDKELIAVELRKAGERAAFACGIELLAPFQLDLESASFEQQRLKDLQRTLAEQEAAGRVEHFNRAADLLKRFEEIRAKTPELSPSAILGQLSPIDQGSTLQTLLLASAKQAGQGGPQALWAVSGEYLVRIDPRSSNATELFPMPPTLGPLRSVQAAQVNGQRRLLVGARDGFYLVNPDSPDRADVFNDGGVDSQMGFSRVLHHSAERGFAGCHGEAGLVRWNPGSTSPTSTLRPQRFGAPPPVKPAGGPPPLPNTSIAVAGRQPGPRNLEAIDDRRLLMSVGGRLWVVDGDEATEIPPGSATSSAEIVAIIPDGRTFHVIHEDGAIAAFDGPTRQIVASRHRPMRVRAAGSLPWLGSRRLLLAGDDGPVQCVGGDDPLVTEYVSSHRSLRAVAGSADLVAAVSSDRQRLIVWQTWEGRSPMAEIYITAKTKHRVADVDFG